MDLFDKIMEIRKEIPPPHFAVFDFDKTLIYNDCAEATLAHMARRRYPGAEKDFKDYHSLLDSGDVRAAYRFAKKTICGLTIRELDAFVRDTMLHEGSELTQQKLLGRMIPRGISPRKIVTKLLQGLKDRGLDVWVVSASPELVVRSTMDYFNIKAKLIGVRNVVEDDVVNQQVVEPLSIYEGKVDCIKKYIHPTVRPLVGVGDSMGDFAMLEYSHLPIVAARNNELAKKAEANGWHIL